ncbi:hypothetical protein D9M72_303210 [compost metagenome]
MLEAHQVHRRAFQFQLKGIAVQRGVQARYAVFVGAEAFVLVFMGLDSGQGQQGEGQDKQQVTHEGLRGGKKISLRYNKCRQPASAVGALRIRFWRSWTCCAYADRSATGRWT